MAFHTRVLRDGEWVTETVNLQAALRASAAPQLASEPLPRPPVCGILSQTIVESPVVRWVLPARLRSSTHNDIAFIGVSTSFSRTSDSMRVRVTHRRILLFHL